MKVLITGGFGYVGGRVAQSLASQQGFEITLGSRRKTEAPNWLPQAKVVVTEWSSPAALERLCEGMDAIVHLAGMNAQECAADPVAAFEFNTVATGRLVRAAVRQAVKRFLYVSTAHVYASPLVGVITEQTCPLNLHPYASSHRAAEDLVRAAHERGDVVSIVARLSNAVGAPTHATANCWTLVANDLCRQAAQTGEMILRSSGAQERDFIALSEVGKAVSHLLGLSPAIIGDGVFNLGSGSSRTVAEVAEVVAARCDHAWKLRPRVQRAASETTDTASALEYRVDKLARTGFIPIDNFAMEIDATLSLCRRPTSAAISHDV